MAQLLVRNLEAEVKARLRDRAARNGRSMEEEVRSILREAVGNDSQAAEGLGTDIARRFQGKGLDFDIPEWRGRKRSLPNSKGDSPPQLRHFRDLWSD